MAGLQSQMDGMTARMAQVDGLAARMDQLTTLMTTLVTRSEEESGGATESTAVRGGAEESANARSARCGRASEQTTRSGRRDEIPPASVSSPSGRPSGEAGVSDPSQASDKRIMKRASSPQGAMRQLDGAYDPESTMQPTDSLKALTSAKISPQENPQHALNRMLDIAASLNNHGLTVNETFVLHVFVAALPDEYNMTKHALRHQERMTKEDVLRNVTIEYQSIKKGSKGARGAEKAYVVDGGGQGRSSGRGNGRGGGRKPARGRGGGRNSGRNGGNNSSGGGGVEEHKESSSGGKDGGGTEKKKYRCFTCGRFGHTMEYCTTKEANYLPRCDHCLGWGHSKDKCPTEEAILAQIVPADADTDTDSLKDQAFCAVTTTIGECVNDDLSLVGVTEPGQDVMVYVADTGATCSMFRCANAFRNYRECGGLVKGIGGDKSPIPLLGYGDVTVVFITEEGRVPVMITNAAHVPESPYNLVSLTALAEEGHTYAGQQGGVTLTTPDGKEVWFPRMGKLLTQHGYQVEPTVDIACAAVLVPGDAQAATPTDLDHFHNSHGHAHEGLLRETAKQQGLLLPEGPLRPCLGCSMAKGQLLPVADEEGREGESMPSTPRQGVGGERDSWSEPNLVVPRAEQETPLVREEAPAALNDGIGDVSESVPQSPHSGGGNSGGGDFSDPSSSSSSSINSNSNSDDGGGGNASDAVEEFKFDPADGRYQSGREGRQLLWGASKEGPLRHGIMPGRTRRQTQELQQGNEEPPGPEEAMLASVMDIDGGNETVEALLSSVLKTERGNEVVENYVSESLVQDRWREEQDAKSEMDRKYRAAMAAATAAAMCELEAMCEPEDRSGVLEVAFGAEAGDDGSSQPLHDPQLSIPTPIGQKPSDVEAVPLTYKDVQNSKYQPLWDAAMKKEMSGHDKTGTFSKIERLPEGRKAVSAKWIFSHKTNADGVITDFKARMVARGFSQIPGVDFHHSSSACPAASSIKTVAVVSNEKKKRLSHWDIKQAYTHAKLKEEVYLRLPDGCGEMSGRVVKVERALYGLKQSGREWGFEAADALIENGYEQCRVDPCVFRKMVDGEVISLIVIYVDDIMLAADEEERKELFASLQKRFPVKDLGDCTWYDGCAIEMDLENGITKLSQTAYIESMLTRFGVTTTAPTPATTGADLGPKRDDESAVDKSVREAIGCLMWLLFTRPDIAVPLNKLQKVAHSPTQMTWDALMRIMSYLNVTKDVGITYVRGSGLDLEVYIDSSYADNVTDRRSTTGLAVTIGGTVVHASTKTQPVTAQSTSEAEYLAAGEGVKEALFMRGVLSFMAPETNGAKIRVLEDNEGALALVQNPFSSARSKHIDVRFHFIRELFKSGKITAQYEGLLVQPPFAVWVGHMASRDSVTSRKAAADAAKSGVLGGGGKKKSKPKAMASGKLKAVADEKRESGGAAGPEPKRKGGPDDEGSSAGERAAEETLPPDDG
eukprot:g10000.t1